MLHRTRHQCLYRQWHGRREIYIVGISSDHQHTINVWGRSVDFSKFSKNRKSCPRKQRDKSRAVCISGGTHPFLLFIPVLFFEGTTDRLFVIEHSMVRAADGWFQMTGYFRTPDRGLGYYKEIMTKSTAVPLRPVHTMNEFRFFYFPLTERKSSPLFFFFLLPFRSMTYQPSSLLKLFQPCLQPKCTSRCRSLV